MTPLRFTDHAFMRARERYGIHLTADDMVQIFDACMAGRAPKLSTDEDGDAYVITHNGATVFPVIRRQAIIVTFLPRDHFIAGQNRKYFCKGLSPRTGKGVDGRIYKRQKVTLADLRRDPPEGYGGGRP
jgi:hypothetical protein